MGIYPLANKGAFGAFFVSMCMGVKGCRCSSYLGGYCGLQATSNRFVKPKVAEWVHGIKTYVRVVCKYPQMA